MNRREIVGSGGKIGRVAAPVLLAGAVLNILFPQFFSVGGPVLIVKAASLAVLALGVVAWLWSGYLIATRVPRKELITTGPFSVVKHPLYTAVALLVLPGAGLLLNTWLGVAAGLVVYAGSRIYSPEEETLLSRTFGARWDEYCRNVKVPWV